MNESSGAFRIALSLALFALVGPFIRTIKMPIAVLLFYSGFFATLAIVAYLLIKGRAKECYPGKLKWLLLLTGTLASINIFTFLKAYRLTTVANTIFPHYIAPVIAALFAPLLLKELLEKKTIPALLISLAGLFLIIVQNGFSLSRNDGVGIFLAAISGLAYGFLILSNKRLSSAFKPATILFYQYLFFLAWIPFISPQEYMVSFPELAVSLAYGLFIILASTLYITGIKEIKAQKAGIIAYVEPAFAMLFGYIFFGELVTTLAFVGGFLILFSGWWIMKR